MWYCSIDNKRMNNRLMWYCSIDNKRMNNRLMWYCSIDDHRLPIASGRRCQGWHRLKSYRYCTVSNWNIPGLISYRMASVVDPNLQIKSYRHRLWSVTECPRLEILAFPKVSLNNMGRHCGLCGRVVINLSIDFSQSSDVDPFLVLLARIRQVEMNIPPPPGPPLQKEKKFQSSNLD